MKTAKEWYNTALPERELIKQIQLDAMKEGMRRAANQLDVAYHLGSASASALSYRDNILTAAEQLTEKDLV